MSELMEYFFFGFAIGVAVASTAYQIMLKRDLERSRKIRDEMIEITMKMLAAWHALNKEGR
jgi:hypothetical protein